MDVRPERGKGPVGVKKTPLPLSGFKITDKAQKP